MKDHKRQSAPGRLQGRKVHLPSSTLPPTVKQTDRAEGVSEFKMNGKERQGAEKS